MRASAARQIRAVRIVPHVPSGRVTLVRVSGFQVLVVIGSGVVWFLRILQATPHRIRQRVDSSEIGHHLHHLCLIDGRIVPTDPIGSLPQHPSDLTIGHATDEFCPWGLIGAAVLNTCLGSVVEELIIADPKGSIPGLVICPSVVGVAGHGGGRLVLPYPTGSPHPQRGRVCQS